jgi:hypothetical protein
MNSNQHIKDARITDYLNNAIKTTRKSYIIPIIKAMDDSQKEQEATSVGQEVEKWKYAEPWSVELCNGAAATEECRGSLKIKQ